MKEDDATNRVLRRAAFFSGIADRILKRLPGLLQQADFRADSPVLMSAAYFLLSDAYKSERNKSGSLTDEYKRAAISAIAVMVVRPISPLDPERVDSMTVYLANPLLALACANAWAADRDLLRHFPFDYMKRFYISLQALHFPSMQPFIDHVNDGGDYRDIDAITLSPGEIGAIDDWVLKIHMLCNIRR